MWGCHGRFIVPTAVLRRLADDDSIPAQSRQALLDSAAVVLHALEPTVKQHVSKFDHLRRR